MPLLNYTTNISADKSAAEVSKILARAKVSSTSVHYDGNGAPSGISFTLTTPHGARDFQLPVNVEGVYQILKNDRSISPRLRDRDGAYTVVSVERGAPTGAEPFYVLIKAYPPAPPIGREAD